MAESFSRWESDPLFSAAEVVQDSADRMESVFRMLLHEQSLVQGGTPDSKLQNMIQYYRRNLATALETTKWQLEDFERAVSCAALSDKSNLRENAIFKHKQFIRAIREQVDQVEKRLESSATIINRNLQWMNLNEQDTNGLALFLSGGDSLDHHVHYDSESSIMRRFLDSTMESDEIIEIKTEEIEHLPMNGMNHSDHMLKKVGSHYSKRLDFETPAFFQGSAGGNESEEPNTVSGAYDLEDSRAKCCSAKKMLRGSLWRFLRNFWLAQKNKGSFTKRKKDGEVTDDLIVDIERRASSSTVSIPSAEQGLNFEGLTYSLQFHSWFEALGRRFQRSQYFLLYNRFPVRLASAILLTLTVLGFLAFRVV